MYCIVVIFLYIFVLKNTKILKLLKLTLVFHFFRYITSIVLFIGMIAIIYLNRQSKTDRNSYYAKKETWHAIVQKHSLFSDKKNNDTIVIQHRTGADDEIKTSDSNCWFITINTYPYEVKN